jgi:hypothetical protein
VTASVVVCSPGIDAPADATAREPFQSVTFQSRTSMVATAVEIPTRAPAKVVVQAAPPTPEQLVPRIKAALTRGAEAYAEAGKLLAQAKKSLKHGEWLPWLKKNFALSPREAQRYLAVVNTTSVSHVPLARAATRRNVRTLAVLRTEPEPAPEDDPQTARLRAIAVELLQAGFETLSQSWTRRLKQVPRELVTALAELSDARDWGVEFIGRSTSDRRST